MPFNANHPSLIAIMLFSVLAARGQTQPPENTDLGKTTPGPVFRVGGGVSAPKAIYAPDPKYSKEALAANYGGNCVLWLVVGPDGKPRDIRVLRTLGLGLDEKAIEAVKNWRFAPAMKDGKPVAVQIDVYINFLPHGKELETTAQAQFLMGEHAYADARQEDRQGASSSADYVKAYVWYELALRGGYKQSEKMLKELAPKMSPEQLSDAKTRADNWRNAPAK